MAAVASLTAGGVAVLAVAVQAVDAGHGPAAVGIGTAADDIGTATVPTSSAATAPAGAPGEDPVAASPRDRPPAAAAGDERSRERASAEVAGSVPAPVAVEIARLGVRSDLVDLDLDERRRLEVPDDPDLAGWYVRGARPGATGPAVIAGHVDSREGPAIFHRLADLEAGDKIVVHREDGSAATFTVDRTGRWPKDAFPTDAVYRQAEGAELRLITCGGAFDTDRRSYEDNVIVFASLVADASPSP